MQEFEWDPENAESNLTKHRVDFADAVGVFFDELAITLADEGEEAEERWVTIGADVLNRILVVVYTWRTDVIRLISARKATRRERKQYEEDR
jgi:uncharacterized protein